jgi:hypothetical protein
VEQQGGSCNRCGDDGDGGSNRCAACHGISDGHRATERDGHALAHADSNETTAGDGHARDDTDRNGGRNRDGHWSGGDEHTGDGETAGNPGSANGAIPGRADRKYAYGNESSGTAGSDRYAQGDTDAAHAAGAGGQSQSAGDRRGRP